MLIRLSLLTLFIGSFAFADDAIIGVPNLMSEGPNLTIHQSILGRACYSIMASDQDIDCNPAFMADEDKHTLRVNIVGNDQAKNFADMYSQLKGDDAVVVADELLSDRDPRQAQAATSIWYQRDYWAVGVVPLRTGLAYLNRNEAYPQLSVYGIQESEAFFKIGMLAEDNSRMKVGVQTRYVARKYIYQKFYALDAIADPDIVEVNSQRAFYIEPGFAYEFEAAWKPTLAAMITNMPIYQSGDELPTHPEFDLGLSNSYPGLIPHFRSTTHYHRAQGTELSHAFSWSGVYDFNRVGALSFTVGEGLFGAGIDGHIAMLTAGLGYRKERIAVDAWNKKDVESTFFEVGLNF